MENLTITKNNEPKKYPRGIHPIGHHNKKSQKLYNASSSAREALFMYNVHSDSRSAMFVINFVDVSLSIPAGKNIEPTVEPAVYNTEARETCIQIFRFNYVGILIRDECTRMLNETRELEMFFRLFSSCIRTWGSKKLDLYFEMR